MGFLKQIVSIAVLSLLAGFAPDALAGTISIGTTEVAAPEPSALLLLGLGFAALARRSRAPSA